MSARTLTVLLLAALIAAGCTPSTGTDGAGSSPRADPPSPAFSPAPVPTGDPTEVRLEVGDDFQAAVDANPPGSTFVIASGVHRMQQVIPRDGNRFVGEAGAIMNGSRVLDRTEFKQDTAGRWFVGGQTQEGLVRGVEGEGRPVNTQRSEDVYVDGDTWLTHVDRLRDLGPGTFFFDYDADRIYLGDDPTTFDLIETSVTPFAFGGTGVRDVVVEDLIVEKYATPHYFGAVGGVKPHGYTYDWTLRHVEIRLNHGAGVRIGPGTTVENADIHHNGQIGLTGYGEDQTDGDGGYRAPVTIRDSRVHHNNVLLFRWTHEAGGFKLKDVRAGSVVERSWFHDNVGPGLWWDDDNEDAVARGNLVEDNGGPGIFYEISLGDTVIEDNIVLRNGVVDAEGRRLSSGISISNSERVTVRRNYLAGNARAIAATSAGFRDPQVSGVVVADNLIVTGDGWSGLVLTGDAPDALLDPVDGVRFERNTYVLDDLGDGAWRWGGDDHLEWPEWQALGQDAEGSVRTGAPPDPPAFTPAPYGPRWLDRSNAASPSEATTP